VHVLPDNSITGIPADTWGSSEEILRTVMGITVARTLRWHLTNSRRWPPGLPLMHRDRIKRP
jgi:hypothetical protein